MQSNDVTDELQEDFEPSALPPIAPDGGFEGEPPRKIIDPPPRLCEAGPCRHYHRFQVQLEVESAKGAELSATGAITGTPGPDPIVTQTHHYCYPAVGIETKLGSLPVLSCNRWDPITPGDLKSLARRDWKFGKTPAGIAFTAAKAKWQAERDLEQRDAEAAQAAIDASLTTKPGDARDDGNPTS